MYDPIYKHRIVGKIEQTPEFTYTTNIIYDNIGRVEKTKLTTVLNNPAYTSISEVKNIYDPKSILIKQLDTSNNSTIWEVNTVNSHGMTTQMTMGNGYQVNTTFSPVDLNLQRIEHLNPNNNNKVVDIQYTYDNTRGVLTDRNNVLFAKNEHYEYDALYRLLKETTNGTTIQEYSFDKRGRMTSNTDVGKYNYNEQNYKLESVNYNTKGQLLENNRGFANIQYNTFKSPYKIELQGKDIINYDHSILGNRSVAYFGSTDPTPANRPNRKFYSADKAIEIVKTGNITKIITYITGDPYSANYMKIETLNGGSLVSNYKYYLHRDNQQTIVAITEANGGAVVEKRYFDAWGNLRELVSSNGQLVINNSQILNTNYSLLIDRGYTGHEHLTSIGLIHMNGRIYDPQLRRFLSPDNYVQDSENTQNYNRFGYVYNNPLLYTDPSGEFGILVAIAVAVIINGINNIANGIPFWHGMGKAGVSGAISAAITMGIGAAQTAIFNTAKAVALTTKEAVMAGIGQLVGNFLPKVDIKLGEFSLSLNLAIMMGNSNGLGLNFQISYTKGDFSMSYGFGITNFSKFNNTGKKGYEYRHSFMATYDDGNFGVSLGTNIWGGDKNMKEFSQTTGVLGIHSGDFRMMYENDGKPFSGINADGNDQYRTAGLNLSINDYSIGFNLFTGKRTKEDYDIEKKMAGGELGYSSSGKYGEYYKNGFVHERGTKYRLGALYFGYKNFKMGVNSEWVRHAIQNVAIHGTFVANQRMFEMTSGNWQGYFQYQTKNSFTTW